MTQSLKDAHARIAVLEAENAQLRNALTAPGNPLWMYTQYDWLCDRLAKFTRGDLSDELAPPELIAHLRAQSETVKQLSRPNSAAAAYPTHPEGGEQ